MAVLIKIKIFHTQFLPHFGILLRVSKMEFWSSNRSVKWIFCVSWKVSLQCKWNCPGAETLTAAWHLLISYQFVEACYLDDVWEVCIQRKIELEFRRDYWRRGLVLFEEMTSRFIYCKINVEFCLWLNIGRWQKYSKVYSFLWIKTRKFLWFKFTSKVFISKIL